MPSGIVHEELRKKGRITAFPLAVVIPLLLLPIPMRTGGQELIGLGIFLGYEFGRYCSNDWDCVTMTEDESNMSNEIPILGHYLFGVSSMYGSVFKRRHRKPETHWPFISTAIRYLLVFWWIFWQIYMSNLDWWWLIFIFIGGYLGLSFSDTIHFVADVMGKSKE